MLEAIANNGKIEVEFYLEQNYFNPTFKGISWTSSPTVYYTNNFHNGNMLYDSSPIIGGIASTFTSSLNMPIAGSSDVKSLSIDASIETGRIEKGGKTDQKMESSYGSYNSWPTNTIQIQLFPESIKPIEVSEIRTYCTECGTRMKKQTWKFCPNCGTKND